MNYPVWYVPLIGSGWVIGIIAITHVYISHFAVGGGLFLAITEHKALREGRHDWITALKGYSKFFLVMTGVFGALTGVGIWFAIGLASPEGTSTLIHNFVFGWAMEWVVFMVELTLAAVYYVTWDRIPERLHLQIGYAYAISSFLTLVIINGILTFMLTPGDGWMSVAGTGNEASKFFDAFFNPTYWPSLVLRSLVCLSLAGIYALVFFSRLDGDREGALKAGMVRWAAKWIIPAYLLMPFFFAWYLWRVPEAQRELLSFGISTIGTGAFTQVTRMVLITTLTTATVAGVVYFLAFLNPKEFRLGYALSIFFLGFMAMGSTESAREMLRKPYVVGRFMYSNGIRKYQVEGFNQEGFMTRSIWAPAGMPGTGEDPMKLGQRMFLGQCLPCHTVSGYRGMTRLLAGRDERSIGNILEMLHDHKPDSPYVKYMPPLTGTPQEIAALRTFLFHMVSPKE
ncbi:MAG TPA: cytochrome ubiquinol oxidase subunit I [bacterium]|nr:cytochrome ubiquinol oxidase subunit I [bacterium]